MQNTKPLDRMLQLIILWTTTVQLRSFWIWFDWETVRFFVTPRPGRFRFPEEWFSGWVDLSDYGVRAASLTFRPLMSTLFQIESLVFDTHAWGYHLINLMAHLVCAALIYHLASKSGLSASGRVASALIFGCHPLATQPMWIIVDRAEQIVLMGGLIALVFYSENSGFKRAAAWLGCIIALLSKETAVTIPLWILALDFFASDRSSRRFFSRKTFFIHLPFYIITFAYLAYRSLALGGLGGYRSLQHFQIGHLWDIFRQNTAWMLTLPHIPKAGALLFLAALISVFLLRMPWPARFGVVWSLVFHLPLTNLCNKWYLYTPLAAFSLFFGAVMSGVENRYPARGRLIFTIVLICGVGVSWKSHAELFHQQRTAAFPIHLARQLKQTFPHPKPGTHFRFHLAPACENRKILGHAFDPATFIIRKDKTPIESIVWDLNSASFFSDATVVWTRSVEAAVQLIYRDISMKADWVRDPSPQPGNPQIRDVFFDPLDMTVTPRPVQSPLFSGRQNRRDT